MGLWIVRHRVWLPTRLQNQMIDEEEWRIWRKRFFAAMVAALSVAILNAIGLGLAFHGYGNWAIFPCCLSALPLVWLLDKAVFNAEPLSYDEPAQSDLIQTHSLSELIQGGKVV